MAPFFLHETNAYGEWQAQDDVAAPFRTAEGLPEILGSVDRTVQALQRTRTVMGRVGAAGAKNPPAPTPTHRNRPLNLRSSDAAAHQADAHWAE
ncbi:hypothetical protein AB0I50_45115, partial [Streptomyces prunicolor]